MAKLVIATISLSLSFCTLAKPHPKTMYEYNIELMRNHPEIFSKISVDNVHKMSRAGLGAYQQCRDMDVERKICNLFSAGMIGCLQAKFWIVYNKHSANANLRFSNKFGTYSRQCSEVAANEVKKYVERK